MLSGVKRGAWNFCGASALPFSPICLDWKRKVTAYVQQLVELQLGGNLTGGSALAGTKISSPPTYTAQRSLHKTSQKSFAVGLNHKAPARPVHVAKFQAKLDGILFPKKDQ